MRKQITIPSLLLATSVVLVPIYGYSSINPHFRGQSELTSDLVERKGNSSHNKVIIGAIRERDDGSFCAVDTLDITNREDLVPSYMKAMSSNDLGKVNISPEAEEFLATVSPCDEEDIVAIQGVAETAIKGPVQVAVLPVLPVIAAAIAKWAAYGCTGGVILGGMLKLRDQRPSTNNGEIIGKFTIGGGLIGAGIGYGFSAGKGARPVVQWLTTAMRGAVGAGMGTGAGLGLITCMNGVFYLTQE